MQVNQGMSRSSLGGDIYSHVTLPMSPRGWATEIMERLAAGGIELPLTDEEGFTVQDIITIAIERAIEDAVSQTLADRGNID